VRRLTRLLVALALAVLAVPALGAGGRPADPGSAHQQVLDFWTQRRVAQAVPRDIVFDPATGRFDVAKPDHPGNGGGGGGGGKGGGKGKGSTSVTGASWDGGGTVVESTGKVLFQLGTDDQGNPQFWVCSASLVKDTAADRSIILTAAHCVYDNVTGEFATNWVFIPDYDAAPAPLSTSDSSYCDLTVYGCWTAEHIVLSGGFAFAGGFNLFAILSDYAFVVVGPGGKDATMAETLGAQDIMFAQPSDLSVHAFGYPHAPPYDGSDLVYCAGTAGFDANLLNLTYRLPCDMTGGASGGPWGIGFADGSGTIMSLNSYRYIGDDAMYGPKFDSSVGILFQVALTAADDTIVT